MATNENSLKVRAQVKKRKPTYKRVQSHQFAKLSETKWRKPKGLGNKVRRQRRGKPSLPQVGFGSPKDVKFLNKDGFQEVIISNVSTLKTIDVKTQIAVISSTVGAKKKLEILAEAKKSNIKIANVKNIESAIKSLTKDKKKETSKKEAKKSTKTQSQSAETQSQSAETQSQSAETQSQSQSEVMGDKK